MDHKKYLRIAPWSFSLSCLSLACACSDPRIKLDEGKAGDILVLVTTAESGTTVSTGVLGESGFQLQADADAEIYGYVLARDDLVTNLGEALPDAWATGLRARFSTAPAPSGSCGRCFSGPEDDPIPVWPGTACPLPTRRSSFHRDGSEEVDVVASRVTLDWPGVCPCTDTDSAPVDPPSMTIAPSEALLPGKLVVTSTGTAALVGEHTLVRSDGFRLDRRHLIPDQILAVSEGPTGYLVIHPSRQGTVVGELALDGTYRTLGTTDVEVETIGYDPRSSLIVLGGAQGAGGLRIPKVLVCTVAPFECSGVNPEGSGDGSFRWVARNDEGLWVARDIAGDLLFLESLPEMPSSVEHQAGVNFGTVSFPNHPPARWAYFEGGTREYRDMALGADQFVDCGRENGGFEVHRILFANLWSESGPEVERLAIGQDDCRGISVEGAFARVFVGDGETVVCASDAPCARGDREPSGVGRLVTQVASRGGRTFASTETGLFERDPGGTYHLLAGVPPEPPVRAMVHVGREVWTFQARTVRLWNEAGRELESFELEGGRQVQAAAGGEDGILVAARGAETPLCARGALGLSWFDPQTRQNTAWDVDLGCVGATDMAWLGLRSFLLLTSDGRVHRIDDTVISEIVVQWDDLATTETESEPANPHAFQSLSAVQGVAFLGGVGGTFVRYEGYSGKARRLALRSTGLGAQPDVKAAFGKCPDEGYAGIRIGLRAETGEVQRTRAGADRRLHLEIAEENTTPFAGIEGRTSGSPLHFANWQGRIAVGFESSFHVLGSTWRERLDGAWLGPMNSTWDGNLLMAGSRGQIFIVSD